jgi:hypothetical protein
MEANSTEPVILQAEKQIPVPKRKRSRKRSITIFIVVTLLNVVVLAFLWTQLLTPAQPQHSPVDRRLLHPRNPVARKAVLINGS